MGNIQNELNDFLYKPTGNHVSANECDSGTNYLRQPRGITVHTDTRRVWKVRKIFSLQCSRFPKSTSLSEGFRIRPYHDSSTRPVYSTNGTVLTGGKTQLPGEEFLPVLLFRQQFSHGLARDRNRTSSGPTI